jgi:aminoglycoside N3'-acetyltransferase
MRGLIKQQFRNLHRSSCNKGSTPLAAYYRCTGDRVTQPIVKKLAIKFAKQIAGKQVRRKFELQKLNLQKLIYRRPIRTEELRSTLQDLGSWRNRVVYVQSSWNQLYNLELKPLDLINLMLELAGPNGTLVMPTHPLVSSHLDLLRIDEVPSSSGLLTELFRRKRGAKRSIHLSSAVSAFGPAAETLTSEHHLDLYAWGAKTPFGKMIEADALLVLLGTVPMGFTPLHSVECALHRVDSRFDKVFSSRLKYRWQRKDGTSGEHEYYQRNGAINPGRIRRHFDQDLYKVKKISNLTFQSLAAKRGIDRALELAKSGVTIYPHL